jgi:hypothetical protein
VNVPWPAKDPTYQLFIDDSKELPPKCGENKAGNWPERTAKGDQVGSLEQGNWLSFACPSRTASNNRLGPRTLPNSGPRSRFMLKQITNEAIRYRSLTIEMIDVSALRPNVGNARRHSRSQIKQIAKSIETFGFTNPILVSDELEILAGHGRALPRSSLASVRCL